MKCMIREIRKEEIRSVFRFIQMHDTQDARYAKRYYKDYFRRWGRGWDKVIVAERAGQLIGVSGYFYDNKEAQGIYWLGFTYIHPRYHGYGIGTQFLRYLQADLKRRKARKLFLATSSNAIYGGAVSFYTNHGFRWEGTLKDFYGLGEDQIIMGKDLIKRKRKKAKRKKRRRRRRFSRRRMRKTRRKQAGSRRQRRRTKRRRRRVSRLRRRFKRARRRKFHRVRKKTKRNRRKSRRRR